MCIVWECRWIGRPSPHRCSFPGEPRLAWCRYRKGRSTGAMAATPSRLRNSAARYWQARRSLHTPASRRSRRGLDWTNFFIADVQTGFGTFVAFYLAHGGWSQSNIGLALAVGTIAGVLSQIPGGALADAIKWKRGLVAIGVAMVGTAALILALKPDFAWVFVA